MFTGIVSEIGTVKSALRTAAGIDFGFHAPRTAPCLKLGASISVNGVCQTVVSIAPPLFVVQAVGATLERSTLGMLKTGSRVNLEPSLRLGDEIGGHLVTGHIDGICRVTAIQKRGGAALLEVEIPLELTPFIAPRGSIALDGVSLTVAAITQARVCISMIPHTLARTIAGDYRIGDGVNVEVDLLARYLDRLLESRRGERHQGITWEKLMEKYS
jgi:riboflavin synthase